MRIGVISEGHADRAVITNILIGVTGIDINDIVPLRPIYNFDETDKAILNPLTFSSWSVVKEECENRTLIDGFLSLEGQDFIVIHFDSAECDEYGVARPNKTANYCTELRRLIVKKIGEWLKDDVTEYILHAVAIEEIEAWILPIYDKRDSSTAAKPKEKLAIVLGKQKLNSTSNFDNFYSLSKNLSKSKIVKREKYLAYNESLNAFYEEVAQKVIPKI